MSQKKNKSFQQLINEVLTEGEEERCSTKPFHSIKRGAAAETK